MGKNILLPLIVCFSFLFTDSYTQWAKSSTGMGNKEVACITSLGSNLFAGTKYSGIYYSTDNGVNWTLRGLAYKNILSLTSNGTYLFAGIDTAIMRSTDNGITWSGNRMEEYSSVTSIAVNGNDIVVVAQNLDCGWIEYSSNGGDSWTTTSTFSGNYTTVSINQNFFYFAVGSNNCSVYISSNYGTNWLFTNEMYPYGLPRCIGTSGNYAYLGLGRYSSNDSTYGICISSNNGYNWTGHALKNISVNTLTVTGNIIIAGGLDSGIYISSNNGQNWIQKNEGLPLVKKVNSLYIYNNKVYAGISSESVWSRPLSELVTGINGNTKSTPTSYTLYQNYPNPFNPATNIRYQISNNKFISIKIFDITGKEITSLVNAKQTAGNYEVNWNADGNSSGVYLYSLYADGRRMETKKMILLK